MIKKSKVELNNNLLKVLVNRNFIVLWLTFIIGAFTGLMAIGISSTVGTDLIKMSKKLSAFAVSFFAIFNGIGRPIFGTLTDKIKYKKVAILSFCIIIIASIAMLMAKEGSVIIFFVSFALFWLILGGWLAIAPTVTANLFGAKDYARNYGFMFTAYGIGALLASLTSGIIRDTFSSYRYVFYPTIIGAILGIVIVVLLFKENKEK